MIRSIYATITFWALAITVDAQYILDPKTQPQFVNPLPIPSILLHLALAIAADRAIGY